MKRKMHKVKVYLTYTESGTPYKWRWDCRCGAGGLSWSWARWYEVIQSGQPLQEYLDEQGMTVFQFILNAQTGALPRALQHLRDANLSSHRKEQA